MRLSRRIEVEVRRSMSPLVRARLALWRDHAPAHSLPGELVISLTSYRPRFPHLHLALLSLLDQSVRPDRLILWISHAEMDDLPKAVTSLVRLGLDIRATRELRSYKKLIPALEMFPQAFIATADDDVLYPRDWLEALCANQGHDGGRVIGCHRAHRIPRPEGGRLRPYREWHWDVADSASRQPSVDLVPTGVGGILYPPRSLHPATTDDAAFLRLCPDADDLWFYWMARRAGSRHCRVGSGFRMLHLPGTIENGLFATGANDPQIANLSSEYGLPCIG